MDRHILHLPVTAEEHAVLSERARETHASLPNYVRKVLGLRMPEERRGKHGKHFRGKRKPMTQEALFAGAPAVEEASKRGGDEAADDDDHRQSAE
jgi:hypothetical protein